MRSILRRFLSGILWRFGILKSTKDLDSRYRKLLDQVMVIGGDGSVVDFGCGYPIGIEYLLDCGFSGIYCGIDINSRHILRGNRSWADHSGIFFKNWDLKREHTVVADYLTGCAFLIYLSPIQLARFLRYGFSGRRAKGALFWEPLKRPGVNVDSWHYWLHEREAFEVVESFGYVVEFETVSCCSWNTESTISVKIRITKDWSERGK